MSPVRAIGSLVKNAPHPHSLSRGEREEWVFKPLVLQDKGTLEAQQRGWGKGNALTGRHDVARRIDVVERAHD